MKTSIKTIINNHLSFGISIDVIFNLLNIKNDLNNRLRRINN